MSSPMSIPDPAPIEGWLKEQLKTPGVTIQEITPLSGGAIQENLLITCRVGGNDESFVLRKDAPATIAESRSRQEEYALVEAAFENGVTVPSPIGFCEDASVIGGPFAVYRKVDGVGLGPKVVKDLSLGGDRSQLTRELGRQLALIHAIDYALPKLSFLEIPTDTPAAIEIASIRLSLDRMNIHRPGLEWGLRWCDQNAPVTERLVLAHRDFRTGNFMVDQTTLTAVLDWEFASVSDPMSDIGWFCAECWRFTRPDLEAGGIGTRADFYQSYEETSGVKIDRQAILFWEVLAHLRWANIALQQGMRHVSSKQSSLELALTGRIADLLELKILRSTASNLDHQFEEPQHA